MPIYEPVAKKVQGQTKVVFCTTLTDSAAPSIATDINAASSVEATMAAYGTFQPSYNINTGNAPARIGTTTQLPEEGNAQLQVVPFSYPYDPSVDDTDPNNKLKALLAEGTTVYAVVRKGVDKDTAWTTGDRVEVWQLRCGKQVDAAPDQSNEFAEYTIAQNLVPVAEKIEGTVAA